MQGGSVWLHDHIAYTGSETISNGTLRTRIDICLIVMKQAYRAQQRPCWSSVLMLLFVAVVVASLGFALEPRCCCRLDSRLLVGGLMTCDDC